MDCSRSMTHKLLLVALSMSTSAIAQDTADPVGWFARTWGGFSLLEDTDGDALDVAGIAGPDAIDIDTEGGFAAGAGLGYRYHARLSVELAWEYRSNDSEAGLASGTDINEGNYASNTFFLNSYYFFNVRGRLEPYVGAGLAWLQEVDIDLEGNGPEQSYSGDGDVGVQLFVGSNYRLSDDWLVHGELRYGSVTGIDMVGENVGGSIGGLDYQPVTLQLGLTYRF